IDLPPTQKPPPVYEERVPPLPQKGLLCQILDTSSYLKVELFHTEHLPLQTQLKENGAGGLQSS
ncbi:hypothetical protein STEG23_029631, partial [Scotinomys teguina]